MLLHLTSRSGAVCVTLLGSGLNSRTAALSLTRLTVGNLLPSRRNLNLCLTPSWCNYYGVDSDVMLTIADARILVVSAVSAISIVQLLVR